MYLPLPGPGPFLQGLGNHTLVVTGDSYGGSAHIAHIGRGVHKTKGVAVGLVPLLTQGSGNQAQALAGAESKITWLPSEAQPLSCTRRFLTHSISDASPDMGPYCSSPTGPPP